MSRIRGKDTTPERIVRSLLQRIVLSGHVWGGLNRTVAAMVHGSSF